MVAFKFSKICITSTFILAISVSCGELGERESERERFSQGKASRKIKGNYHFLFYIFLYHFESIAQVNLTIPALVKKTDDDNISDKSRCKSKNTL